MFKKKGKKDKTDLKYTIGIIIACIALVISIIFFVIKLNKKNNNSEVGICDKFGENYILIKSEQADEESGSSHFDYYCCEAGGKNCTLIARKNN